MPAVARPESQSDLVEAVTRLVDLLNEQGKQGLSHNGAVRTVILSTSDLEVPHGLGRTPTMCFPLLQNASASIFVVTPHTDPRNFIFVQASAAVTATLLIA